MLVSNFFNRLSKACVSETSEGLQPDKNINKTMKKQDPQKLQPTKFALAITTITAATAFFTTILALINPNLPTITPFLQILYGPLNYNISATGAIIGAIYISIDTFILTYLFAWLYNKLL